MNTVKVLKAGLQTTLQDSGRRMRALGLAACGAADPVALALANALVGNTAGTVGLELSLSGPSLLFETDALVALCGAPFEATLNGNSFPLNRAIHLKAGQVLSIAGTALGLRAILAVHGGWESQFEFGSGSTDLSSSFGGYQGRALKVGDMLTFNKASRLPKPPKAFLAPSLLTSTTYGQLLRVLPTSEATPTLLASLKQPFTISSQANRIGPTPK